jgi:hypothetical protein
VVGAKIAVGVQPQAARRGQGVELAEIAADLSERLVDR